MIKRVIQLLVSLLILVGYIFPVHWYITNLTWEIEVRDQAWWWVSWVLLTMVTGDWESRKITNSDGKVKYDIRYNSDWDNWYRVYINWNWINSTNISPDLKTITIVYDKELDTIIEVKADSDFRITNQAIKMATNYYAVITFVWVSLVFAWFLIAWRLLYDRMSGDIYNHTKKLKIQLKQNVQWHISSENQMK